MLRRCRKYGKRARRQGLPGEIAVVICGDLTDLREFDVCYELFCAGTKYARPPHGERRQLLTETCQSGF